MKLRKVSSNFTQVSNYPLRDSGLSLKAKGLYAMLYSKPDEWEFALERMAKREAKDGKAALYAAAKELEESGYLTRKKHPDGRMEYVLDVQKPAAENREQAQEPTSEKAKLAKSQVAKIGSISNTDLVSNTESKVTPDDFDSFWVPFPRKVGKASALKAWSRLSNADRAKALAALPSYAASVDVKREGGRFVLHPASYLNGRRFEDEFVPLRKTGNVLESPAGKYAGITKSA